MGQGLTCPIQFDRMVSMIVTDETFEATINSHNIVLMDFWAPWCGPCKKMSPILDEISVELPLWVGKLNVDENPVKSNEFSVSSIPTMILFKDGKPIKTIIGAMPKHSLIKEIQQWI
jgi:thioredoxin 1